MIFELKIKKKHLFFREEAEKLAESIYKKIKRDKLKNISLEFSDVDFMSRSFVDEFLNKIEGLERKNIKIQFIHLKPSLNEFINYVKKTKSKIRKTLITMNSEQ